MYDIIKSRKYYGELKAGTLLRADGDGSKMIRVREITGPNTCTVESYGRLTYGNIKYASQLYVRNATFEYYLMKFGKNKGRRECNVEVITARASRYNKSWGYTPVEIYSIHPTVQSCYDAGVRSGKRALSSPMSYGKNNVELTQRGFAMSRRYGLANMPWPQHFELCAAWCHGYWSVPVPDAAAWLPVHFAKVEAGWARFHAKYGD